MWLLISAGIKVNLWNWNGLLSINTFCYDLVSSILPLLSIVRWLQVLLNFRAIINSLWPSDVTWHQRSWSTLVQVMACCLTAPSHYLNQCWFLISDILWHLPSRVRFPRMNWNEIIFKIILATDGRWFSCELSLKWRPLDLTVDKSTLVQVIAWCYQVTSHYLSPCWLRSMLLYHYTKTVPSNTGLLNGLLWDTSKTMVSFV